jgi:hypothetical protein
MPHLWQTSLDRRPFPRPCLGGLAAVVDIAAVGDDNVGSADISTQPFGCVITGWVPKVTWIGTPDPLETGSW